MSRIEWGIFSAKSTDHSPQEAIEEGYLSREEAEAAIEKRYRDEEVTAETVESLPQLDPQGREGELVGAIINTRRTHPRYCDKCGLGLVTNQTTQSCPRCNNV